MVGGVWARGRTKHREAQRQHAKRSLKKHKGLLWTPCPNRVFFFFFFFKKGGDFVRVLAVRLDGVPRY